jgi:hypothetical protein
MRTISVRKPARPVTWLALVTLLSGFFVTSGFDSQDAQAAGQTVAITPAGQPMATKAVSLGIEVNGTFSATDYQATVVLVNSSGSEVANGDLTIAVDKRAGLTALTGRSATEGSSLGFSGAKDVVIAALTSVTWTPASQQSNLEVQVSLLPKLPANVFYNDVNGRYYEHVTASGSWSAARTAASGKTLFGDATTGLRGYLVHISTAQENQFIANNVPAQDIWIGATDGGNEGKWRWDGLSVADVTIGTQRAGETSSGANELGFVFDTYPNKSSLSGDDFNVTGEFVPSAGYADWSLTVGNAATVVLPRAGWTTRAEPNNSGGNEHCAATNYKNNANALPENYLGRWNDFQCSESRVTGYLVEFGGRSDDPTNLVLGAVSQSAAVSAIAAPSAPTIDSITPGNRALTVNVTAGATGGSAITNFQYSTDGGSTFQAFTPAVTSGPLTITTQSTAGNPALVNEQPYDIRIKAVNIVGAGAQSGVSSATPVASKPGAPTILSVTGGDRRLSVAFSISDNGGDTITSVEYRLNGGAFEAFSTTTSPATITGLTNGQLYTLVIRATNSKGTSDNSASASGTPVSPPPPGVNPQVVNPPVTQPPATNGPTNGSGQSSTPANAPAPLNGPLPSINGNGGQAPSAPNGSVGGRPTTVTTNVVGGNQMNMQAGSATFGVVIPAGQGQVNSGQNGNAELSVQAGGSTNLSGSGLFPGSMVQVFMPLGANGSRELSQIPVGPTGLFDGDAVFTTRPTDPPLPIGRHVMQIASLNAAGERVVVEMAITIAQPSPLPGILLSTGQIPTLTPGQSFATRAGEPTNVSLIVDPQASTTTVQGNGWAFSVDISGGGNQVSETSDGGALLSMIRGGVATISGNGFMPLTRADIWLFSEPTLLGSVELDENGAFTGSVTIDGAVIPVGDHTLQIQGVGVDGFVLAANLGVVVTDAVEDSAVAGTSEASSTLLWWVLAIFMLVIVLVVVAWRVSTGRRQAR